MVVVDGRKGERSGEVRDEAGGVIYGKSESVEICAIGLSPVADLASPL